MDYSDLEFSALNFFTDQNILVIRPIFKTDVMAETKPFCLKARESLQSVGRAGFSAWAAVQRAAVTASHSDGVPTEELTN